MFNTELKSSIRITDTGIEQDFDTLGVITRRFVDLSGAQMEGAIRDKLIAMGWTPPPEEGKE